MLNKIIFKKQQNSISMMEGCNTGLQTNNTLMDAHFPGSVPWDCNPKATLPEQMIKRDVSEHQNKTVIDKSLNFTLSHVL